MRLPEADFVAIQLLIFVVALVGLTIGAGVSERVRAESELERHKRDLARKGAAAATGTAVATVAHEISQPLSALGAYVHAARRLLAQKSDDRAAIEQALANAEAAARRGREVVARVRDFVSTGALRDELLDLRSLAADVVAANLDESIGRGVEIVAPERGPPVELRGDRGAVEQAIHNLVSNAVDAAAARPAGGGRVLVRVSQSSGGAVIAVLDNGGGVSPDVAERIFEPFETTKPSGMGLGLSLVRQIAKKHGGSVRWAARRPEGTVFTIEIPDALVQRSAAA
jgi:signal transduction histidine kinase